MYPLHLIINTYCIEMLCSDVREMILVYLPELKIFKLGLQQPYMFSCAARVDSIRMIY